MKAVLRGDYYDVTVTEDDVFTFAQRWPGFGPVKGDLKFTFSAKNGDLVDLDEGTYTRDDGGIAALSDDAGKYGAQRLDLTAVLAVRDWRRLDWDSAAKAGGWYFWPAGSVAVADAWRRPVRRNETTDAVTMSIYGIEMDRGALGSALSAPNARAACLHDDIAPNETA